MSVLMKKPRIESVELITIGEKKFQVSKEKARAFLVLLKDEQFALRNEDEDTIPSDEVFKDEIAKYTKPGLALRGARQKENLSQVQLAKKLKIDQTDLSKMEYGKRPISKKMAKRLAEILNIDYRVFL